MNAFTLKFKFEKFQTFKNMGILPLFVNIKSNLEYIPLEKALAKNLITITEVNQTGSVPELKVTNKSSHSILMLDGEELIGAKQNRVLNTSILLRGNSEATVPVSCTEQGRWEYVSDTFSHSDNIMSHGARARKVRGVTDSLSTDQTFFSDQTQIWTDISRIQRDTDTFSSTRALGDVYTAKSDELSEYQQAFECVPHQMGSLIFINGEAVGFEVVSQEKIYKTLHPKLIRSYAMEALLQRKVLYDRSSEDEYVEASHLIEGIGPVSVRLAIGEQKREVEVPLSKTIQLGRLDPTSGAFPDIDLTDDEDLRKRVSRRHARILKREGTVMVEDLGSLNGTYINAKRLTPYMPKVLRSGDQLQLGKLLIKIKLLFPAGEASDLEVIQEEKARALLQEAQRCKKSKFASISQGYDYRLQGLNAVGSALVFEDTVIHFIFFKLSKSKRVCQTSDHIRHRRL